MSTNAERTAKLETDFTAVKSDVTDHETRLRKLERLIWGVLGAALVLSWVVTQANNMTKLIS